MLAKSNIFAMHMLSADPDEIDRCLEIPMTLGGSSGCGGDKIVKLRTGQRVTAAPMPLDTHSDLECRDWRTGQR